MSGPNQLKISSAFGQAWDAAIVGAGPAGAIAAIRLSMAGHRVLLVDRERFPREKTCGDGLVNDAIQCLKVAGAYEKAASIGHSLQMASVFSPSGIEVEIPAQYLTIRREILDSILVEKAIEAGAVFCLGKVERVEQDRSRVLLSFTGEREKSNARFCLVATGAEISLAKNLGMIAEPSPSAVAVRRYVRSDHRLDRLVGVYGRSTVPGYGWIFPMGRGEFNVGIILFKAKGKNAPANIRKTYERFTDEFPLARKIVRRSSGTTRLAGGTLRCGLRGCRSWNEGRVLLAGEVVGTTLPFTAEGIGKAMESGEIAAEALHEAMREDSPGSLDAFSETMNSRLRPVYFGYEVAQKWLGDPRLNDFMARRVVQSPYLRDAVAKIVTAQDDPRKVFSLKSVLNSLWR